MSVKSFVDNEIATNKVVLFGKSYCPHCKKAKEALASIDVTPKVIELDEREDCSDIQDYLGQLTGARSVPRVFVNGKFIGGGDDTVAKVKSGELRTLVQA
ncbi:glutaredoxin-1, putative [Perkinsus marinus ATCC 50983]|uniref:Glutaredoxin-1, putative n=1 Tax=Perkinsus marinus (strain ATCC 50983 / TXsc) TaxID=423536 RepID=C5KKI4_PERM5|nr:glutaredoxin-1, putative [Perkinsus marinus ATCC 50983]EER15096.1 glutaredoxin-1, putative [Perkinsus marinus ATCC 50983]|eukprot:XP_002783300.1 glutaredoxin-1, putative [Perkinsus marinus ATCC 50983]